MSDTDNAIKTIKAQQKDIEKLSGVAATLISVGALTPAQASALQDIGKINKSLLKTVEGLKTDNKPLE